MPLLKETDEKALFENYKKTGSVEDRNKIVERYLYIADILVKKYVNKGVDYDDLYQVASVALILAAERYDLDRGISFPAFATPTVLGEIKRYFRDKAWALKVPRRLKDISVKIPSVQLELEAELGRAPKVSEIAKKLDITEELVLEAMESSRSYSPVSLQQSFDEEEDSSFNLEQFTGMEETGFSRIEDSDFLRSMMEKLSKEEQHFFRLRFLEGLKQSEIAAQLGVSQMTVSRIEKKIKTKFKEDYLK